MTQDEQYWKNRPTTDPKRDWDYGSQNWIFDYFCSALHPHRKVIISELKKLQPIKNILEVGCNIGPNLLRIQDEFPKIKLAGVDINEFAIAEGKRLLKSIDFRVADLDELPFKNKSFDYILADAVLIYVDPSKISCVIMEMDRVCKKGMILVEWHNEESVTGKIKEYHWCRNYKALLEEFGYKVEMQRITKENWPTPKWQSLGRIYTCLKK
jgi:ubiquinone/menaquinone biosynthesis C-methylase UbiE